MTDKQLVQVVEHIKEHVRATIVAFQDGVGDIRAPFTADLAIRSIWNELDNAFDKERSRTAAFRVSAEPENIHEAIRALALPLISVNVLGPRNNGDNAVCYVVAVAKTYEVAAAAVQRVVNAGAEVRDWSFVG